MSNYTHGNTSSPDVRRKAAETQKRIEESRELSFSEREALIAEQFAEYCEEYVYVKD